MLTENHSVNVTCNQYLVKMKTRGDLARVGIHYYYFFKKNFGGKDM